MNHELIIHYAVQIPDLDSGEFEAVQYEETITTYRQLANIIAIAMRFNITDTVTGEELELADARRFLNQKHQESIYDHSQPL